MPRRERRLATQIVALSCVAAACADGTGDPTDLPPPMFALEGGASTQCALAGTIWVLTGHFVGVGDTTWYHSPEDCYELPAGTTLTVQASYMLDTGAHGQNEGHRFYRKVIGYDGDGIDDDSVLLGSFTRSAGVLYPVDSNTFTGISMPTTGAGLKIFLDVDNDRNFLFLMNLFKPLASPSALEATLASYNKIDLTWTNGVTGTLVDTRILAPDYLTDLPTPTDSFRVTASQLNTQYCFRILHRVENAGGGTIDILSDTTSTECVTTPPQLWVNIRGPIIVRPEQECTWYTSHGGGITPYSWTWLIDDDTVGTGESWTGNAGGGHGSSFELEVHLASSDGQDARGTHTVSVVDTAPPFCPK